MKKKIIAIILIGFLLLGLQWLFSHAYISVTLANPGKDEVTYQFLNQANQKITEVKTEEASVKKLVRKGDYEVLVRQNDTSYLTVVSVGGFLGTTTVRAETAPEKTREFIGNNPAACMALTGQTLISYGCSGFYANATVHLPASAEQPTYTQPVPAAIDGLIQGIISTPSGNLALLKTVRDSGNPDQPFTLYTIGARGELTNGRILTGLDPAKLYVMGAYKNGFIVYDTEFEQVVYYSSPGAQPTEISLGTPLDSTLKPYALSVGDASITAAYSNNTEGEVTDIHDPDDSKVKTELAIADETTIQRLTFEGQYSAAVTCGRDKLCLQRGDQLEVYSLNGDQPQQLFALGQVSTITRIAGSLLVARRNELIGLAVDTRVGSIQYSYGDYTYCGLQTSAEGYLLCLINSNQEKVALAINAQAANDSSIDKKVADLLKLPEIKDISAYGRFIYLSPDLGEPVYNESTNSFGPDPAVRSQANSAINQAVNRLGIDRNTYTIINTFE